MDRYAPADVSHLIVFARMPEPGRAKTRLIPALGPDRAARLHAALVRRTLDAAARLQARQGVAIEVRFAGGDMQSMSERFGSGPKYVEQVGEGLGERLTEAVEAAFRAGAARVVVVGTDCPELDADRLEAAFAALRRADLVVGPALDGGYYLIGMNADSPELFQGVEWGGERVFEQTLANARRLDLKVQLLEPLGDVDHPEDLILCRRLRDLWSEDEPPPLPTERAGRLSIVIPTLNEARLLAATLDSLPRSTDVERIVADGGSADDTVEIARRCGATVVSSRAGRGRQMNAGAAVSSGERLLFLHADARLPTGFESEVERVLSSGSIAGAFQLRIDDPRRSLRWIERLANARSRRCQRPYGDQAIFLRAATFFESGGFLDWPLMEDYEFCRRMARRGRIGLAESAVTVSARRWQKLGVWRTTLINQLCVAGFHLGVSPDRLARWYRGRARLDRGS